jgi:hypothetical protein
MTTRNEWLSTMARGARWIVLTLALGATTACDDLLEVELPAQLTDEAMNDPKSAVTLRNSIIGEFETGFDYLVWQWYSREDAGGTHLGSAGVTADGTNYDTGIASVFGPMQTARRFAYHLHDKLDKEWTDVADRGKLMAISSIYAGAAIGVLGQSLCEATVATSELMSPDQTLALADQWLTKALTEIAATGDFALPYGIASSANALAYGLRAQVRWMKGDAAGAKADAERVPRGFTAYVTREPGVARRNKAWNDGPNIRYSRLNGVNDWWTGAPNPVNGQAWPKVIPFTGYTELGILADGRAVREDGLPIRKSGPYRNPEEDAAVADTRVKWIRGPIQGSATIEYIHNRYPGEGDDIPMVNWKEMWLIRAELEGGQRAIDLVNEVRTADNLPLVTYATASNTQQIRYMIIEERRRALFLEGRFFSTKLENLDLLWFPRAEGRNPNRNGQVYSGGVRLLMPGDEYTLNPNLGLAKRGTGCAQHEKPVNIT